MGANFYHVVQMMKDRLKCNAVPIQLPIGAENDFSGIIDLVTMKAEIYHNEDGNGRKTSAFLCGAATDRQGRNLKKTTADRKAE